MTPPDPPPPPAPPPREITLEEWIAAGQACCGVDHDDPADERGDTPVPDGKR